MTRLVHTSRESTGTLFYSTLPNAHGAAGINIIITDGGDDGIIDDDPATVGIDESADNGVTIETFIVTVELVNDDPTMDEILPPANQHVISEQTVGTEQTIALTGIAAGPTNELEDVRVSAELAETRNIAVTNGARVVGDTLTVNGIVFTYVDSAVVGSPTNTQIAVDLTASSLAVASATADVLDDHPVVGSQVNAVATQNTVSVTEDVPPVLNISASSATDFTIVAQTSTADVTVGDAIDLIGETITVNGTVFTFVDATIVMAPAATQIAVDPNGPCRCRCGCNSNSASE